MATIFDIMRIQKLTNQWEQKNRMLPKRSRRMTERPNSVRCDSSKLFGARYPCLASSEKLRQDIRVLMMEMLKRESYKQKLKACKTKEDVARVKMTTLGNFMSQAKSIEYST